MREKQKVPQPGDEGWWKTRQVCEFADVSHDTLARWCAAGKLKRYRFAGQTASNAAYRYCVREVKEFVAGLMQPAGEGGQ